VFEVELISKGNCVFASFLLDTTIQDGGKRERSIAVSFYCSKEKEKEKIIYRFMY